MLKRRAAGETTSALLRMTLETAIEPQPESSSLVTRAIDRARGLHPVWLLNVVVIAAALLVVLAAHGI